MQMNKGRNNEDSWLFSKIQCQNLSEFIERSLSDAEASISLQTALSLLNLLVPASVGLNDEEENSQ